MTDQAIAKRPGELETLLEQAFDAAKEEVFEDGMESVFSQTLASLVESHGHTREMQELLESWVPHGRASSHVISECLRSLGRLDHPVTHEYRRRLLERCLQSQSSAVRDAAGLGLASMDDPESAPAIRAAIAREAIPEIRENLKQVLEDLGG
jgi:hypothetical protein